MFGLFASPDSKMRESAKNWLEVADKVWHFRRDVIPAPAGALLRTQTELLRRQVKEKASAVEMKGAIETLEEMLQKNGGAIYPKSALVDNIEFLLVASIVIIGVRTFFVQPFKIPTNSMWPTYNGMTAEIFPTRADEPSAPAVAARAVVFGAWPHRMDAPVDGEVLIPVGGAERRSLAYGKLVPGTTWLVIPTTLREYTIFVGERPVTVKLPVDFDFDAVLSDAFFQDGTIRTPEDYNDKVMATAHQRGVETRTINGLDVQCVRTGHFVKAGERVLSFDERTGDQLFVDRVSYNFTRPKVGQGFVFWTGNIRNRQMEDAAGRQIEQYYVKRLVGTPGDKLEIKEPMIYRNGAPITGAAAFAANANREPHYNGYSNSRIIGGYLAAGETVVIPARNYFAMGDNSANSKDSRYWGFVPAKEVIGRPLFIYFPFSRHWGPTR